ncbi:MAG: DUF3196 family protein [Erysipelotrichaceae bacterium]|uniref:DUF3196 family protein n=1 Tax=Floccifex sp. TaxID=2815810 RepID=UPI002A75487F|nr:DUF3196 family protein [Floccifex sp.]MDD7281111.1 DUF3196 family protein [Erysipelotrichaceae bacterium]MDY2957560.1 DUF3196 family protein [Floccifex sp.]
MNSYYQSLMSEIKNLMSESKWSQAYDLICQENSMPYVPQDVLEQLEECQSECKSHLDVKVRKVDDDKIMEWIHGTPAQQEKAVSELVNMNLRNYVQEVQAVFDSNILDEFKGELIEALMEQKIDTPYKILKNGLEITFIPSSILTTQEDKTLIETKQIFSELLSNDNPAFYQFCNHLLEQEVLEMRPFDFSDLSAISLAKSIIHLVMEAFGQSEEFLTFIKLKGLEEVEELPLLIERRGENDAK